MRFNLILCTFGVIVYFFSSCANVKPISGGPKDTIPPSLIHSNPENKSLNYRGTQFSLEFDERIKADKIKDQLIITPFGDFEYKYSVSKNALKLSFDNPFKDSTTYTFNFRDAIQDITEGNVTLNNKFIFSTGSYIDSLSISGNTKELFSNDTLKNITVGLYKTEDTITIFNGSPYYFSKTDDEGFYNLENIKNGSYRLYAFNDSNKNLKLEPNSESYAFLKDTLQLSNSLSDINLYLYNLDTRDLEIKSALASGKYFDVNFNKYITDYSITDFNNQIPLVSNFAKEHKSIRIYNNFKNVDSLQFIVTAFDSLNNSITDTLYAKFTESKRKADSFVHSIKPKNNAEIEYSTDIILTFSKPVEIFKTDSILLFYDTTLVYRFNDSTNISHNKLNTEFTFSAQIDKSFIDSLITHKNNFQDSLNNQADSISITIDEMQTKKPDKKQEQLKRSVIESNQGLLFYCSDGSFISIEQDSSSRIANRYKFFSSEDRGILHVNANTKRSYFTIQLLSTNKNEVELENSNNPTFTFKNIKPGEYKIRVLIDNNENGKWDLGNMNKNIPPEEIYFYPDIISIRSNWESKLELSF